MGLYRSFGGQVRVRVTSADIPGFLDLVTSRQISVSDVRFEGGLDVSFTVLRSDFRILRILSDRQGNSMSVQRRIGLYWTLKRFLSRPVLLAGLMFLLLLVFWLPGRVLFVEVEGNVSVPSRQILAAAEENGIRFGASRRQVRSETVKNALLEAVPELRWAGINTRGCVAVISVREKIMGEAEQEVPGVSSIVASCDGVILSATATAGELVCSPGQVVTKGQVLICGYLDGGLLLRGTHAQGEIYASTVRELTVLAPASAFQIYEITEERTSYSLIIGKNRINLWKDSGKTGVTCGRMYAEYYITLPGGFRLPVAIAKDTVCVYDTAVTETSPETMMADFAGDYLLTQLIAGVVLDRSETVSCEGDAIRMDFVFHCTEMIGRRKAEEIGDLHE